MNTRLALQEIHDGLAFAADLGHTPAHSNTSEYKNQQGDASIDKIRNTIPTSAIHWQAWSRQSQAIVARSKFRGDAQENTVAARAQNPGITQPATAVPVLKLYCQTTKIQPAAADGSTKVVLPENENPARRRLSRILQFMLRK